MGSNQFQKEYIEYLQERNAELIGRLNYMKQHYENKILSRDLNKHYLMSTLNDVSRICSEIPREIDIFFDKMTAAMGVLKNILLRKAEMVQIVEKISKVICSTEKSNSDFGAMDNSDSLNEPVSEITSIKKAETVKVSPMINGHIISTEPRILLSRMPEIFTPETRKDMHQLSPIIEASPDIPKTPPNVKMHSFKEITIPVEKLKMKKMSFNCRSEESPKSRFKGPKTWKKSLTSTKCQSENQRNLSFSENKENIKKISVGEIENSDPMEGPSWLHNQNETRLSPNDFINYRRRKHRFATVFDKNEESDSSYEGKTIKESVKSVEKMEQEEEEDANGSGYDRASVEGNDDVDASDYKDFNESHKTKEVNEESQNKNRQFSMDLFWESRSTEIEEKIAPDKRISPIKKRKRPKCGDIYSVVGTATPEQEKTTNLEKSTDAKIKSEKKTSTHDQSSSSPEENNEEHYIQIKVSRGKCIAKCITEATNPGTSSEKTTSESEKTLFLKLENCPPIKERVSEKWKTKCPSENVSVMNTSKNESESLQSPRENTGRKKRKAAPTFKLVEPKLSTKLRRN